MQLIRHPTSASDNSGILFPRLESWNNLTKVATIAANVNKKRVLCRISLEILRDKFGATEENPMGSMNQHRAIIQKVAKGLIENGLYEEDGSILMRSRDFETGVQTQL